MAEVVLDSVTKRYVVGGPLAVRDFSLRVREGELVVLVGPSGCGKTTTLRLIAGLEDLTSGDIFIGGRTVNNVHPRDRNIAMVFQDYALYPHMTAYENMAFGLRMRRTPRREVDRRVRDAASMLGMSDLLHRRPGALSGGQRQRVALGRAIVRLPGAQCFLFDEPLSNLDARMRTAMRGEIRTLHQRLKMTSIYVTHDQEEAMTLGDRVVVMAGGELQQDGAPLEVYRRPRNRFVAGFLGTPQMNFIEGRLAPNGTTVTFVERGQAGARLALGAEPAARLRERGSAEVALGVRPEDLSLARDAAGDAGLGRISAIVRFAELLGDQVNVHATTTAGTPIVARMKARNVPKEGASIILHVDPTAPHVFAPGEFGENLLLDDQAHH